MKTQFNKIPFNARVLFNDKIYYKTDNMLVEYLDQSLASHKRKPEFIKIHDQYEYYELIENEDSKEKEIPPIEYDIVEAYSSEDIVRFVNEKMSEGWQPIGGITQKISFSRSGDNCLMQAIKRNDK